MAYGAPVCATRPPSPAPSGSRSRWNAREIEPSVTRMYVSPRPGSFSVVRFEVDVSTPGPVRLALNALGGVSLWIDGVRVEPSPSLETRLSAGVHAVTLALDHEIRRVDVRCALEDVSGSPARAQIVLGK